MKAAYAFDGDYQSRPDAHGSCSNGVTACNGLPVSIEQAQTRAAFVAGIGLRVKAARGGRIVFALACGALCKLRHARVGAVIRQMCSQRVARAAVDTVDEGMAVAPVVGIEQFSQAFGTDRHVRCDAGQHLALPALRDTETL